MITLNVGWAILIGLFLVCVGFFISAFLSGSKIGELDTELKNQKIENNRKDTVIKFYQAHNVGMNTNNATVTNIIKERKSK